MSNFESEEQDFMNAPAVRELREKGKHCPTPELLRAAEAGVLPEKTAAGIRRHLESCILCRTLAADLADPELSRPTEEEERRIHGRVFGRLHEPARRPARIWLWRPVPVAAMAALVVLLGVWFMTNRPPQQEIPQAAVRPPAPPPAASVLRLEKPPLRLPAAALLVFRGEGDEGRRYAEQLAKALEPYRADDFAASAARLEPLVKKWPRAAEAHFYLGVCRLFLGDNTGAVTSLNEAGLLALDSLALDAAWYLALAQHRSGNNQAAATEMQKLCASPGERRESACAAARELGSSR